MTQKAKRSGVPPRGVGRPGLSPIVSSRVREIIEDLLTKEPYVGRGGVTRLAEALNISQPAVTQIRDGGGVSPDTAIAVARLVDLDPRELLGGAYVGVAIGGKHPNLAVCLAYHSERWSPAAVAAVQANLWQDDVAPDVWAARLDEVDEALRSVRRKAEGGDAKGDVGDRGSGSRGVLRRRD